MIAVLLAALMIGAVGIQVARDRWYPAAGVRSEPLLYVRSGEALKRIALSFDALAADIDWIRAVQHYGAGRHSHDPNAYALLYPLLDRATTLDPQFNAAYRFGAVFLSESHPIGAGRGDLAIALLRKGIEANPHKWQYYQDIGFIEYWQHHDYAAAARAFEAGAAIEGAPWWLRSMAAVGAARGGDRASSRLLWQQMLASADNDWLRDQAGMRLAQLDAMDQIDELTRIVADHRARTGRLPASWRALFDAGLVRTPAPADPSGALYELDAATGDVRLALDSPLRPLPTEPPGGEAPRP
jgi:hypothetical protein